MPPTGKRSGSLSASISMSPIPHSLEPKLKHIDPNAVAARATSISKFRVFARVRPFIPSELEEAGGKSELLRSVVEMTGNKTVLLDPKESYAPKAQFEFDDSLWSIPRDYKMRHTYTDDDRLSFASQQQAFELVASECAIDALKGINSSILAYGQTGSGKTYSMMGHYDRTKVCGGPGNEGIIPRVCHDVFEKVEQRRKEEAKKAKEERANISVQVTFVEVYMEKVRDLLDPKLDRHRGEAHMREARIRLDPDSGPFVEDVTKYAVEDWATCCRLLERGAASRRTCANIVHTQSSRSHAIFTLTILEEYTLPAKDKYSPPVVKTRAGRINLVDLAGSERGGFQDYVKESAKINASLLALRRVIDTLLERQQISMEQLQAELAGEYSPSFDKVLPAVPFRDSVLTWLLSDSMGGNARTTMIAALSPHEKNFGDTLATLQWSSKARGLVGVVKVNDMQSAVAAGMKNRASDMSGSLATQRQNVDGLRSDLDAKQKLIDDMENNIQVLAKTTKKLQKTTVKHIEVGAAVIIQKFVRCVQHRRRMKSIEAEHTEATETATRQEKENAGLESKVADAQAARDKQTVEIRTCPERTEKQKSALLMFEAQDEEFQIKYATVKAARAEITAEHQRRAQVLETASKAKRDEMANLKQLLQSKKKQSVDDAEAAVRLTRECGEITPEQKRDFEAKARALEEKNRQFEAAVLVPLREEKSFLLPKRDGLAARKAERLRKQRA